ncbi:class I SAM-dependent methyltransferase [Helicobacter jaachi]|uniref:class I SAM-dependent methyltransferase n=1 Tax=Helicobacter jaachi TaxID=1677920 RepID=UPI001EE8D6FB|nr:class I SAM-dependent methyltransferase [Helicobacter jaachi]
MNEFLRFYGEHHISPVSQDISDFSAHLQRRKRLYELVGIHPFAFRNASILEVGAGSGYNTLLFLHLGAQVDIVEPNAAGREQMQKLFTEHNIPKEQYRIYPCTLQDYKSEKIYDFVIAEGFLPWLSEKEAREVVQSLYAATKKDGAVVVTSMCEFSYFFEDLRRILGFALIKGVKDFEQKVSLLASAFSSHLLHLKFASRPIRDWVIDNILNPASNIANPHNIATCIKLFRQVAGGGGARASKDRLCEQIPYKYRIYRTTGELA